MIKDPTSLKGFLGRIIPASIIISWAGIAFAAQDPASSKGSTTAKTVNPTDGFKQYTDTYKVQQPYDLKVSDRFVETNGEYICWVNKTDKPLKVGSTTGARTEMRWKDWTRTEHRWEADVFVEPGTDHTAIMQVKSNTGGEPIYLQVQNNNLYNDNDIKTPAVVNFTGKWFHIVTGYNPETGLGQIWVNGELKLTRTDKKPLETVWYFKNGVYNTSKTSKAHFKNVKFWIKDTTAAPSAPPAK